MTSRRRGLCVGGGEISLLEWNGDGPFLLLHHANGFCAAVWEPVVQALGSAYRVVALDARGHGDSFKPREREAYRWNAFADDLVGVAEALVGEAQGERVAIALGHSFGATATLLAAAQRPDLFERLLLLDPAIPVPAPELDPSQERRRDLLAASARRRRDVFGSRDEARTTWSRRRFFSAWDRRALDAYVRGGLRERDDGRVELKCPKEIEATIFEASGSLDLSGIAPRVPHPVLIVWAQRGSFPRPLYERVAALLPRAMVQDAAAGHLIPMECPEFVARTVRAFADHSA